MIARIQPLTTTRKVSGPFDYAIGDEPVAVGSIVSVPFGRQRLSGVVVELAFSTDVPAEKLMKIGSVRPETIPGELVELALWMAGEYCSTSARALSLVLPPPGKPRTVLWARRVEPAADAPPPRMTERQRELLKRLPGPAGPDLPALRRLESRGLVELVSREQRRSAPAPPGTARSRIDPTHAQDKAVAGLISGTEREWLLHGVTGSGKTEVYLRAAAAALARGRGVMVLVPEIALTPQTVSRFQARFGDTVALLHSGLSEGERYDEWRRLRSGEARVVVGPRSAVFAPVADLGLVVIDEEHDSSFKHEGDPRYDARLVASRRAEFTGATVVVGSATPRPESWHALPRIVLPDRVDGQPLPTVKVLDMRAARHQLHPETRQALSESRKSILLLNRRGWSNFLSCRSCGHAWECPNCDVALVLHRQANLISCHHCGHREPVPRRCEQCGSLTVGRHGAGTERLEAELSETLDVPVFRLDADTAAAKDAVTDVLGAFAAAHAGVLLGTQIVAKGHDFPDVSLGVVLDADSTLRFPDFRAEERTFALITQLAGRAGRGRAGGRVLVQTSSPDANSIAFAARHDARGFLAEELERRRALRYPPFSDLIRIVCSAPDARAVRAAAADVAERLRVADADLLGPAPLFRLRSRERMQLVLKARRRAEAVACVGSAVEAAARDRAHSMVSFSVDVDPQ